MAASLFFFASAQNTGPKEDTNSKLKAVFLYSFSKYVDWPEDYKKGSFIITVLGNNASLIQELGKMAENQNKSALQPITIKSVSSPNSIEKSHIIFIPFENSALLGEVLNKVKGQNTLIVTEKPGLARQGAAINFVVKENKQLFELNKLNAERNKLKLNANLYSVAILVE